MRRSILSSLMRRIGNLSRKIGGRAASYYTVIILQVALAPATRLQAREAEVNTATTRPIRRLMASTGPTVWVVHDGKIGMANQVIGLAEAVGFPFVEKRLDIRSPWRHLPPQLWLQPLAALRPGGRPAAAALARSAHRLRPAGGGAGARRQARERRPHLLGAGPGPALRPARGRSHGGARARSGARRQCLRDDGRRASRDRRRGSPKARARFAPLLADLPRPLVAVLIGGDNRVYRLTQSRFAALRRPARRAGAAPASASP